jgi:hypothetical protein
LFKNKIIRQFSAIGLLLLFILSNTPKQFIHDVFANHVDYKNGIAKTTHDNNVYQSSFHCPTDNLVAESPFTNDAQAILINVAINYLQFTALLSNTLAANRYLRLDLRGPPVV